MNFFISPLIIDFIVDYLCSETSLGDIKIKFIFLEFMTMSFELLLLLYGWCNQAT